MNNYNFHEKQFQNSDHIEIYFECISSCDMKNRICISSCVEILKEPEN